MFAEYVNFPHMFNTTHDVRERASELDKLFNQNNEYVCIMYIFSVCSMIYLYTYENE